MTKQITATVAQLRAHIYDLGRAFGVRVIESAQLRPDEAFAVPGRRLVVISAIVDDTTYAVALHEQGHVVAPTGDLSRVAGDTRRLTQAEEDAAWTWARHYALIWTPAMDMVAHWAEGTYHQAAPPTLAPPTDSVDWTKY